MNKILACLFLLTISYQLNAQILPKEGSQVHYRLIGFAFRQELAGCKYKVEVAEGNYNNEDSFKKNIIASFAGDNNRIIGEVPSWGKQYTWRAVFTNIGLAKTQSRLHHFSTQIIPDIDTSVTRIRVLKKAEKYKDAYVFMDGTRALYDMDGRAVWFLPEIEGMTMGSSLFGDLKQTPQGTITFLSDRRNGSIFDIDYYGNVLWTGPNTGAISGDTVEHYNHEFTRLANGHYMVLGAELVFWELPSTPDSSVLNNVDNPGSIVRKGEKFYQRICFITIIEYDDVGNVVWKLKTSQYFKQGTGAYYKTGERGVYDLNEMLVNSFFFDEKEKAIYIGFRNINQVLKVQYPNGKILSRYGNLYDHGVKDAEKDLFCGQHSCRHSPNGYIYMFNNNGCHSSLPRITIIKDKVSENDTMKKIWEYECTIDSAKTDLQQFSRGGNVIELPDNSMFTCMSNEEYTKVFIVDRDKKILWSAIPERWDPVNKIWHSILQYRSSIVTRKELEKMIWCDTTKRVLLQ